MTFPERTTDPSKINVQMNIKIPWDFREYLREQALLEERSLNALVRNALSEKYGKEFIRRLHSDAGSK